MSALRVAVLSVLGASACTSSPPAAVDVPPDARSASALATSTAPAPTVSAAAPDAKLPVGDFALYPGATTVCWQHVSGNTMHIQWWAYSSPDPPERVAAFYGVKVGETKTGAGPRDKLSVHAAGDPSIPRCDSPVPAGAKTVLIVSTATG